jgi:uncharacterized protein
MYFAITAIDRPRGTDVRARTRPAHREYLHAPYPGVTLRLGRSLRAPDRAAMTSGNADKE